MDLTIEEKQELEDSELWGYGPVYSVTFLVEDASIGDKISTTLRHRTQLKLWKGDWNETPFYSVLKTENTPPIGFIHTFHKRLDYPSYYQLSIYPRQFKQYVGAESWKDVSKIDLKKFYQLHTELFKIVQVIFEEHTIFSASICDESYGWASQASEGIGVFMLARHIRWLNKNTEPFSDKRLGREFEFFPLS
jgi:hypothetical protein